MLFNDFSLGGVVLYTVIMVFSLPQTPGQNPGQKSGQKPGQRLAPTTCWLVYLLFPGPREKLRGGFLESFDLFSEQFSVNFPNEISRKNRWKSFKNFSKAF